MGGGEAALLTEESGAFREGSTQRFAQDVCDCVDCTVKKKKKGIIQKIGFVQSVFKLF